MTAVEQMSFPARTKIFSTILFFVAAQSLFSAPPERSVSPSQQFIVYGADAAMRGAVSNLAERTKANLLTRLQQRDNWKTPIVINLQFPQANLPDVPSRALYFSQTGSGLKLQLDLMVGTDNNAPELQRELLRAILLEMIYRNQPGLAPGTVYVQPPEWLLDGLLASQPGQDRAPLAAAVAPLIASSNVMSLDDFLRQKFELLDASSRSLYRAYALALLELLVDGTNGPKQLARYIDNLSRASNDPLADLKENLPAVTGTDIEKSWQSNVSKLSRSQKYELLTFAETERRLVEVLALKINATNSRRLQDFLVGKISPAERIFLIRTAEELLLLAASANPAMRPIVTEYQDIAQRIAAGKRHGLRERLARLNARRARLVARMNDVDDYMNWFEATQSKTKSGVFADYLKTVDEQREAQLRRRDPLSVYLDAVELQMQN
jgi:hypothetical protein